MHKNIFYRHRTAWSYWRLTHVLHWKVSPWFGQIHWPGSHFHVMCSFNCHHTYFPVGLRTRNKRPDIGRDWRILSGQMLWGQLWHGQGFKRHRQTFALRPKVVHLWRDDGWQFWHTIHSLPSNKLASSKLVLANNDRSKYNTTQLFTLKLSVTVLSCSNYKTRYVYSAHSFY